MHTHNSRIDVPNQKSIPKVTPTKIKQIAIATRKIKPKEEVRHLTCNRKINEAKKQTSEDGSTN